MSFRTTTQIIFGGRNCRAAVTAFVSAMVLLGYGIAGTAHAAPYHFLTIDNPVDISFNQLLGINNDQIIVGYNTFSQNEGYILVPDHFAIENFPNAVQTQVTGINNHSPSTFPFKFLWTVGFYVDAQGNNFGFTNVHGVFTGPIQFPNTPLFGGVRTNQLLGINDNLIAVGFFLGGAGNSNGYTYDIANNKFAGLHLPFENVRSSQATGINNSGIICGFYTDKGGNTHGFFGPQGGFKRVDVPASLGTGTTFLGINNNGILVGLVTKNGVSHGLVYNSNSNVSSIVDDPHQSSTAAFTFTGTTINGVNDHNDLVGFYSDGLHVDGFLAAP